MTTILFVCSGNTCRSPMAEAILSEVIGEDTFFAGLTVRSAGTLADEGAPMSGYARQALEKLGVGEIGHHAAQLTPELIKTADIILAMQAVHLTEVLRLCPDAKGKAHTLKAYARGLDGYIAKEDCDILDPFGGTQQEYERCAEEIRLAVTQAAKRLVNQGGCA